MADEDNSPRSLPAINPMPYYAGSAEEANLKKLLIDPIRLEDKFYDDIVKDLRTSNIPHADMEYYLELIELTKQNTNLALRLGLDDLAGMERSELSVVMNGLVSVDGFQLRNLGTTTGYQQQTVVQREEKK